MQKTVVITGCSSGIGLALVSNFLKAGWQVVATLRGATERKSLFASLDPYSAKLHILNLDINSDSDRANLCKFLKEKNSAKLDLLINNAGFGQFGPLELLSEKDLRTQFEVNFFGTALLTKDLLPCLRRAKGKIINVSSVFGFLGFAMSSAYVASKFALEGFSESLALELLPHGVDVCLVEPGSVKTSFGGNSKIPAMDHADYAAGIRSFRKFREDLITKPGTSAEKAAKLIFKLTLRKNLPLRYRVGNDATFAWTLRRFLPSKLFFKFQKKLTHKILAAT
jgi:short-subunit dehydrogenase